MRGKLCRSMRGRSKFSTFWTLLSPSSLFKCRRWHRRAEDIEVDLGLIQHDKRAAYRDPLHRRGRCAKTITAGQQWNSSNKSFTCIKANLNVDWVTYNVLKFQSPIASKKLKIPSLINTPKADNSQKMVRQWEKQDLNMAGSVSIKSDCFWRIQVADIYFPKACFQFMMLFSQVSLCHCLPFKPYIHPFESTNKMLFYHSTLYSSFSLFNAIEKLCKRNKFFLSFPFGFVLLFSIRLCCGCNT